ncbi:MAG: hypothetical protein GY822_16420 [Deltaproteobacteria bacterium]|nr:hypothetical protein [Deltaproteobacteria bacterium]
MNSSSKRNFVFSGRKLAWARRLLLLHRVASKRTLLKANEAFFGTIFHGMAMDFLFRRVRMLGFGHSYWFTP